MNPEDIAKAGSEIYTTQGPEGFAVWALVIIAGGVAVLVMFILRWFMQRTDSVSETLRAEMARSIDSLQETNARLQTQIDELNRRIWELHRELTEEKRENEFLRRENASLKSNSGGVN